MGRKSQREQVKAVQGIVAATVRRLGEEYIRALDARSARSRGGKASSAVRREPWRPWQEWIHSHPHREFPKFQRYVISIVQSRARGTPNRELELKYSVPTGLPIIFGKKAKPPSERSIRRHLFGAK